MQSKFIATLAEELPPIILRSKVRELTAGLISPKTLSNHDALRTGPTESSMLYGKKYILKRHFLSGWKRDCLKTRNSTMDNYAEQKTDIYFDAGYLSLGKAEYGNWRSYKIKLDSLPSIPAKTLHQGSVDLLEHALRECPDIALISFTKLEDGKFKFTGESSQEIVAAAHQAGLAHINAWHVDLPFTAQDVFRETWKSWTSGELFTSDLNLTS